jgi:citrate synthase
MPKPDEVEDLQKELRARAKMPDYVWAVLKAMPADSHPMVMLNTAILVMEKESVFRQRYDGMKDDYWAARRRHATSSRSSRSGRIYRMRFREPASLESKLDWGGLRLCWAAGRRATSPADGSTSLHCDHESGNVSAMTTATSTRRCRTSTTRSRPV